MNKISTSIDPTTGALRIVRGGEVAGGETRSAALSHWLSDGPSVGGSGRVADPYGESTWVYRGIKYIAGQLAEAEMHLLTPDGAGGETEMAGEIPAWWRVPGHCRIGKMGWGQFLEATVGTLAIFGRCHWVLDDSWLMRSGEKSKILVPNPEAMRPVYARGDGETLLGWTLTLGRGRRVDLLPEQVVTHWEWSADGDWQSMIEPARDAIEADRHAGRFANNLMANNGDRGPYIVAKGGGLTEDQQNQITRALREKKRFSQRGEFKAGFFNGDIEVRDPAVQAIDAAFIAQRVEDRHEVAVALGLPMSFFSLTASYSVGSASDRFRALEDAVMPMGRKILPGIEYVSQALDRGTVLPMRSAGGQEIRVDFDYDEHSVMQEVRAERIATWDTLVGHGVPPTIAAQAAGVKLPRYAGDEVGRVPFNLVAVDAEEPVDAVPDPEIGEESRALEELTRMFAERRCCAAAPAPESRAAEDEDEEVEVLEPDPARLRLWARHMTARRPWEKRYESKFRGLLMAARTETLRRIDELYVPPRAAGMEQRVPAILLGFELPEWLKNFLAAFDVLNRSAMTSAAEQLLADELSLPDQDASLPPAEVLDALRQRRNYLRGTATEIYNEVQATLEEGLLAGESIDEMKNRVRGTMNGIAEERAKTIAITETGAAFERGRWLQMKASGVTHKEWISSQDGRVRRTHVQTDGQVVPIDGEFSLPGGIVLHHPAESGGPPQEVINCRCVAMAATAREYEDWRNSAKAREQMTTGGEE